MRYTRSLTAALLALLVTGGAAACATPAPSAGEETLTLGWLNPSGAAFDFGITYRDWNSDAVYEPLVYMSQGADGRQTYDPGAATEWSFNDDLTVISITLREGQEFTDGVPVDAQSVTEFIDLSAEQVNTTFSIIRESVEITGEYTFDIHLTAAATSEGPLRILEYMSGGGLISPDALADRETLAGTPVGSGPYVLVPEESTPGVQYTYVRNDDYWNPERYPYDTVVVKGYSDVIAAANALTTGQVDLATIDASTAAQVEGAGLQVIGTEGLWSGLFIGDRGGQTLAPLADVRVRQAMNYAFDREAIAETVDKGYSAASPQPWSAAFADYLPDLDDYYPYDPDKARELMAEAGYADGFDLTIPSFAAGIPTWGAYEPVITQSLGDIGIRVTFEPVSVDDILTVIQSPENPVMMQVNAFTNSIPQYITTGGLWNAFPYRDARVDELLETRRLGTPDEVEEASQELGRYVLEQAWFVVLTHPFALTGAIDGIEAVGNDAVGDPPFLRDIRPAD